MSNTETKSRQSDGGAFTGPAVRLAGLEKKFGGVTALHGIDLTIGSGQVHALVGENGAGKSTCLGVLAGRVTPDSGEVELFGEPAPLGSPKGARQAGVASIYQELTIVPELSTQANVFLGSDLKRLGFLREREMVTEFRELCSRLGIDVRADVDAGTLSIADQQLLEVMRALTLDPQLILFDEPTAALAPREREVLYGIVRSLQAEGRTVVFVSHNLEEVIELSDQVTVFRDGELVESKPVDAWTKDSLVEAMLDEKISGAGDDSAADRRMRAAASQASGPALEVRGLEVGKSVRNVDLDVRPGEILGLAGLVGSGRSTILRAIAGVQKAAAGQMSIGGADIGWPRNVRSACRHGIFTVPEDRRRSGLVMELSGLENIILSDIGAAARFGFLGRQPGIAQAREAARAVGFQEARLSEPVANLSGGNQQKILLARAVYRKPLVLLADEPTRGVDVGAKAEIAASLRALSESGMSIIAVSSEFEELEEICDRVLVLSRGQIVGSLTREETSADEMLRLSFQRPEGE
jgi:ribose transport system ATP-binding protein/rhamnose transport system ATP-binding protein